MTTGNAFGRVFPPTLFLIVSLFLSGFWSHDPLMFITALTVAGGCGAWLIVSTIAVAKLLVVDAESSRTDAARLGRIVNEQGGDIHNTRRFRPISHYSNSSRCWRINSCRPWSSGNS